MVWMWKVSLKDGRTVRLRFLSTKDEERLFKMFSSMSNEALKWSRAPYTLDMIKRWIANIPESIPIVAECDDRIVGYASIFKFPDQSRKGIGDIVIYLHQDFHNVGLGTTMTERLIRLATKDNMHRISLSVVKENTPALALYRKFGFQIEGICKDAFHGRGGKYHDIVNMGLINIERDWKGCVIAEGLNDPAFINGLVVCKAKISEEDLAVDYEGNKGRWHSYDVKCSREEIDSLQPHVLRGWYAHFWKGNRMIVVYNDKQYELDRKDKGTWKEAIEHGKKQRIPEKELDFRIE